MEARRTRYRMFSPVLANARNLSTDEQWRQDVQLVFGRLDENQRRWVAALLSKAVGWGGEAFVAALTGLDFKTIRTGKRELDNQLQNVPTDRGSVVRELEGRRWKKRLHHRAGPETTHRAGNGRRRHRKADLCEKARCGRWRTRPV